MKLGILADIHGDLQNLRTAVKRLTEKSVDQFVVLGDVIYNSRNAPETVAILEDCKAIGVFGNHELGLCVAPDDDIASRFTEPVLDFFATLHPQLTIGDVLFSHMLPNQPAEDPAAYYLGPYPDDEGAIEGVFAAFPHRLVMVGHFHRWFATTESGRIDWSGDQPLALDENRFFLVIHAVMNGWAAVYDSEAQRLEPIRL